MVEAAQQTLLPVKIDVTADQSETLKEILPQLKDLGFDIEQFGQNSFVVNGAPTDICMSDVQTIITEFVAKYEDSHDIKCSVQETVARTLAKSASLFRNPEMTSEEMKRFVSKLLANKSFTITPEGQIITVIVEPEDLLKKFN